MDAKSFSRAEIGRAVQQECRDRDLHSFPTRRSSDLQVPISWISLLGTEVDWAYFTEPEPYLHGRKIFQPRGDRKSGSAGMPRPRSTLFPYTTLFRSSSSYKLDQLTGN